METKTPNDAIVYLNGEVGSFTKALQMLKKDDGHEYGAETCRADVPCNRCCQIDATCDMIKWFVNESSN